jgi:hypothetical protein
LLIDLILTTQVSIIFYYFCVFFYFVRNWLHEEIRVGLLEIRELKANQTKKECRVYSHIFKNLSTTEGDDSNSKESKNDEVEESSGNLENSENSENIETSENLENAEDDPDFLEMNFDMDFCSTPAQLASLFQQNLHLHSKQQK